MTPRGCTINLLKSCRLVHMTQSPMQDFDTTLIQVPHALIQHKLSNCRGSQSGGWGGVAPMRFLLLGLSCQETPARHWQWLSLITTHGNLRLSICKLRFGSRSHVLCFDSVWTTSSYFPKVFASKRSCITVWDYPLAWRIVCWRPVNLFNPRKQ